MFGCYYCDINKIDDEPDAARAGSRPFFAGDGSPMIVLALGFIGAH
jgi:hypothetical protein